jgi:hypothetical protein
MKHRFEMTEIVGAAIVALVGVAFIAVSAAGAPKKTVVTCTHDVWTCDGWSVCDGARQTRVCTMSYDCPGVTTPKPDESRECVGAARGCEDALWSCDDWQPCDADGMQARACHLAQECPGVVMTRPQMKRACPSPQCEDGTLRERVACRLELSAQGRARLASFDPVPEACRALNDAVSRAACAATIASFAPCFGDPDADLRLSCARTVLGVSDDVVSAKADCLALPTDPEKSACLDALREASSMLVIFRMEDLISQAEKTCGDGGSLATTTDFVSAATQAESDFLTATVDDGRLTAVHSVAAAWNEFSGKNDDGLAQLLRSFEAAE